MRPCVFPVIDHAKSSRSSLHSPVRLYYYYALHLFSMYTSLVHSVFYIFILRPFSLLLSPHRFAYLANSQCVLAVRFELVLHSFSLLLCSPSPSPPPHFHLAFLALTSFFSPNRQRCDSFLPLHWLANRLASWKRCSLPIRSRREGE